MDELGSLKIGVFGSSAKDEVTALYTAAHRVGELIAQGGHRIITGACNGVPLVAVLGAKSKQGFSIGFTAATTCQAHETLMDTSPTYYDELVCIPEDYLYKESPVICKKYRNVSSVAACDAAIFISGRWGTLNEFSIAFDTGKVIGVLTGIGKFASQAEQLVTFFNKTSSAHIIYQSDPDVLLEEVVRIADERRQRS